jgi:hypothetical protein
MARLFDELPHASIITISRPDAGDITPMLLSYIPTSSRSTTSRSTDPPAHPFPVLALLLVAL